MQTSPERLAELEQVRAAAVDASLEADRIEAEARKARRKATARMKDYERRLQEAQREN
jgi:hypothetical protein